MPADALASCVAWASAVSVLAVPDRKFFVPVKKDFQYKQYLNFNKWQKIEA